MLWAHKGKEKEWKFLLVWEGWDFLANFLKDFLRLIKYTLHLHLSLYLRLVDTSIHDGKNYGKFPV